MKKSPFVVSLLLAALFCYQATAQLSWPPVTQTMKPWTRWWWEGSAVNKTGLTAAMQKYQQAGLGGLEITPIYGVKGHEQEFIPFLSSQWMSMLDFTLQEARRLNLGIDLANATGWPFGGPWVSPVDACKNINLKTYTLNGGESLKEPVSFTQQPMVRTVSGKPVDIKTLTYPVASNKDMQTYAFDQVRYELKLPLVVLMAYPAQGAPIDLTDKVNGQGELNWTAPAGGSWTLYALFQGWHGKIVERAAPGGEGDVIDHFSAPALQHYLEHFDQAFAGHDLKGIRAVFNDSYEVDDARGQSNWTPDFLQAFQQKRGYDLRSELPALYQKDSTGKHTRVLSDYRQTISELLLEKFTLPWHEWSRKKGMLVRNQSHGSPANILDLYAAIDIPETEGNDVLRFKFATSAAHVTGKPLASSESATWLNEHFQSSLGDVKQALDKYFIGGVNHIFYHGTNYSPPQEAWPGWLFYAAVHFTPANPFWSHFSVLNNYVARCQSFLQTGRPDNDILLYFPFSDALSQPGRDMLLHFDGMEGFENTRFHAAADSLLGSGYAFDLISDKQLQQVKVAGNALQTGGTAYKTILLADSHLLPLETYQQLFQLVKEGATVLFLKNLPSDVPGYGKMAERQAAAKTLLQSLQFAATDNGAVKKAVWGKGAFLLGDNLPQLLQTAGIRRESMVDQSLQFVRRAYNGGTTYFIKNGGTRKLEDWVPLQCSGMHLALYNPSTKAKGIARSRQGNKGTEVFLQLEPGESCLVQAAEKAITGNSYPYSRTVGEPQPVSGTWQIKFLDGGPSLPAAAQMKELVSWTELPDSAAKKFSGTASYRITLKKPRGNAVAWMLDLGTVSESAEIILNGKALDTLIGPRYQLIIPAALLKADNTLEVKVINGMANRIADMDKKGIQWKKFYNVNFPSRLPQNRGANGIFDASKWQPKPAGLMGPVTMTAVEYEK
ncbi:MAG: glycoside hydrolase family 2 protein [Williamsia sp.]|nr:glycoside hydrolase family 2 protein [Williamsia sp.]